MSTGGACDYCWCLSFLLFSYLTCHLEDIVIGVLWFHCATVPMCRCCFTDGKETDFRSSDQEASPSAGKNTGVVLLPCSRMEMRPYSYFWWCGYFWGLWVSFFTTDEFSVRVHKLFQGLVSHDLTAYLSIFNLFKLNELWPYYQKHVNQIILNRTTLWSLALRIFEAFVRILLIVNLSLNQSLLTFLTYVRQAWMTQLIVVTSLWEVSVPLKRKDSSTHMHGLAVYMKEHGTYL